MKRMIVLGTGASGLVGACALRPAVREERDTAHARVKVPPSAMGQRERLNCVNGSSVLVCYVIHE